MKNTPAIRIKGIQYALSSITEGGLGIVYKGVPVSESKKPITIKVLKKELSSSPEILKRFFHEKNVVKTYTEIGIPKYIASGKTYGSPYYAYEYIEGETLHSHLFSETISISESRAAKIIKELLLVIDVLHHQNPSIIHSDISPENILLSDNELFLIDYGCSQFANKYGRVPESKWIGKPSYLSPEQAQGKAWGVQSDLYQAGIIFYELLTGKKYNLGSTISEKRLFAASPTLPKFETLPAQYCKLIQSLLAPNPINRVESAQEAIAVLNIAMRFS